MSFVFMCAFCMGQDAVSAGTTKFVLDGNRIYARLSFSRPDGSTHKALAFVDMGSKSMALTESLFKDLELDRGRNLVFRIGDMSVQVAAADVGSDAGKPYSVGSDLKVEAELPAGVLEKYVVVIDYRRRTLTLARPGSITIQASGIAVPFHLRRDTGLIAVDALIDGQSYPVTIDNGSAYTWFRQSTVKSWLSSHPDWERGVGAVGASNMRMSDDGAEASGILVRLPEMVIGPLTLKQVGVLGAGPGRGRDPKLSMFDWYATKNALPVIGWVGGNVLTNFRLTIDYPNQVIYWLKEADAAADDLNQVGLTLRSEHGEYIVAAVAEKNGRPTVAGVLPGDRLIRVGNMEMKQATRGAIYKAMRGKPGEIRKLVLERDGNRLTVAAKVTAF
jgi:hypothetical protein